MMIAVPDLLSPAEVARVRGIVDAGDWVDGNVTSGPQAALAKQNMQLAEESEAAREAGRIVLDALGRAPLFIAAALPLKIFPPLFNATAAAVVRHPYDNAVASQRGSDFASERPSATLFLADPTIMRAANAGRGQSRRPARQAAGRPYAAHPASSLHRAAGAARRAGGELLWIQSMVRDDGARSLLFTSTAPSKHRRRARQDDRRSSA